MNGRRSKSEQWTGGVHAVKRFGVEDAERAHELTELDHPVALEIEEVEPPICEAVVSVAGPEPCAPNLILR